jgi:EmrB/QacA subfamily drug resistance transporter
METRAIDSPTGNRGWLVLLAVGVGTFMSALDGSVVNTVLPVVRESFGSTVAAVEWVVTVYLLAVSGLLLTFGRLGDLRGHKTVYLTGFCVFVIGSALCGAAPAAAYLVAFRALQALGAAMLYANAPAILTKNFPANRRGRVLGLTAMMTYLGLTAGPSFGGWLADFLGWRSVFYINVPIGTAAAYLSARFIPRDRAGRAERFDAAGALTFMGGLVLLLFALNRGHAWGWGSPLIAGTLCAAGAMLGAFVAVELRAPAPMLDLSLFGNRMFAAATASAMLNYVCLYSVVFLMPFTLIQGRGLDPAQAGFLMTAQPLVMAVSAPLSGTLSDRIGARLPGTVGMAAMSAGLFLLSRLGGHSPLGHVAAGLAVVGLGTGIFISPNSSALMGSAPLDRQGTASGILATARNAGMAVGVGFAGAIFTTILARGSSGDPNAALYGAAAASYRVASGVALLGALASAVRGRGNGGLFTKKPCPSGFSQKRYIHKSPLP